MTVHYKVELTDETQLTLLRIARAEGYDFNDAGPLLAIRRLLIGQGLEVLPPAQYNELVPQIIDPTHIVL